MIKKKELKKLNPRKIIVSVLCLSCVLALALGAFNSDKSKKASSYANVDFTSLDSDSENGIEIVYTPVSESQIEFATKDKQTLPTRKEKLVDAAMSLVGKVHYFWGGKSESVGWDDRWGTMSTVTSTGSKSTGSTRPFGLDCSGFVTWCFIQTGFTGREAIELVGNGTWNQWDRTKPIKWEELEVGDLVFQREYPTNKGNHVGICIGFDEDDEPLFAHCSSKLNSVVITHADNVFKFARRPNVYELDNEKIEKWIPFYG